MTCRSIRRSAIRRGRRTPPTVIWTFPTTTISAYAGCDGSSAPVADGALQIVARGTRQDGVAGEAEWRSREAADECFAFVWT
jgi:hypothetical protein